MELLLSTYEPFWLWLGMDTVLALGAASTTAAAAAAAAAAAGRDNNRVRFDAHDTAELREFLTQRFLHDPAVDAQFATNAAVPGGLYRDGYYAAYGKSMLKRFLALVLLLDTAAQQHGACVLGWGFWLGYPTPNPVCLCLCARVKMLRRFPRAGSGGGFDETGFCPHRRSTAVDDGRTRCQRRGRSRRR